jgi:hypothetical protein
MCDYTPVEVLREAICDILARRVDSVSPERALIGQPVDVIINGSGFGNGTPTVSAGSGITVSNIQLINGGEVRARFTIATNAPPGNHAVSVTTSLGLTTSVSGNFFVQIPSEFIPLNLATANLDCPPDYGGFGAQVTYRVADQAGQPINFSGLTPQEHMTVNGNPAFSGFLAFATPPTTDANGRFLDTPIGTCAGPPPPSFNLCVDVVQTFKIVVGSITFSIPTVTTRRDCMQGMRVVVTTGTVNRTSILGTVN